MQTREAKIAALEEQFLHKQRLEMGGLLKRIQCALRNAVRKCSTEGLGCNFSPNF